jgi:hypothetical protein
MNNQLSLDKAYSFVNPVKPSFSTTSPVGTFLAEPFGIAALSLRCFTTNARRSNSVTGLGSSLIFLAPSIILAGPVPYIKTRSYSPVKNPVIESNS